MPMWLDIVVSIAAVAIAIFSYYISVRRKIENNALVAINEAEKLDAAGAEKMSFAVTVVYDMLPVSMKPFITRSMIEKVVQKIFDEVENYAKKQVK